MVVITVLVFALVLMFVLFMACFAVFAAVTVITLCAGLGLGGRFAHACARRTAHAGTHNGAIFATHRLAHCGTRCATDGTADHRSGLA